MKVLITGATGFIGSHLAESLFAKGYNIRCLVRKTSNLQWLKHLPIEYVYGDLSDLTNSEAITKILKDVDYIYHSAGVTKAKTKREYYIGNQLATRNLLNAILEIKPNLRRFIHISSLAAVGPSENGKAVDEKTPYHPITTYGKSKMEAEKECLRLLDNIPITIIRPPAVYGPRDTDVFEFFNTINKGLQPLIGFKKKLISLIHVKDLVNGVIQAGEHPKAVGQIYFISSERFYDWKYIGDLTSKIIARKVIRPTIPEFAVYIVSIFAELFSILSNKPALLNLEKAKDIIQNYWTCDISKAKRELGFKELLSLEEGIKNTVQWYRDNKWLS